jgi:hypothetical protein
VQARRVYENALMPLPEKGRSKWDEDSKYRNGESYLCAVSEKEFDCTLTCLPTPKTVTVDLHIKMNSDKDAYRRAFLDILWRVEKTIKLTRALAQLIQAFRTTPKNNGFINRSIKEIYAAVGNIL